MTTILNKLVKTPSIDLVKFFYPNFRVMKEVPYIADTGIIFVGSQKDFNSIRELGVPYILISGIAEVDLTNRKTVLEVVYSKFGKEVPKYVLEQSDESLLREDKFIEKVKVLWVSGTWVNDDLLDDTAFFKLIDGIEKGQQVAIQECTSLLNNIEAENIEAALLSFLLRCKNIEVVKDKYTLKITNFKSRRGHLIEKVVKDNLYSGIKSPNVRLLNLVIGLASGKVEE